MSTDHKAPKKNGFPPKKKFSKIRVIKKPLIIGSIAAALAVTGLLGGFYFFNIDQQKKEDILVIGMEFYLNSLDPLYNPDDLSFQENNMVWSQIIEGLFEHNQSREDTPIIPCLAKDLGTWSADGLNFTVPLKEGVKFHDGTPFNATAVKWNFERLYRFIDTMLWGDIWVWYYMYLLPDGRSIINETRVIDEYTVRFVLNEPYAPLRAVLATFSSYILSPTSTPENDFVDKFTGKLIGTGPFMLESYDMDPIDELCGNLTLIANEDYWELKPKIDKVHFLSLSAYDRMEKVISGEIHYTPGSNNFTLIETCKNATSVYAAPRTGRGVFYVAMNYDIFPLEMRKAMSYAFNYSDYIKTMFEDRHVRCKSPLPKGMLYSNWDFDVASTDIQIARQTLKNASWPGTSGLTADDNVSAGNEWEKLVDDGMPLETYNFSYVPTVDSHVLQSVLFTKYFKQIGINVSLNNLTGPAWWDKVQKGGMEFYTIGWGAAFNDPVEILNPLFSENSPYNHYNFTDAQVEDWLNQGLIERNETARRQIYYDIQKRLIEDLYPVIWTHTNIDWEIWASNVKGIPLEGVPYTFILKYAYLEDN